MDIYQTCQTGNVERVKELLKNGVDPTVFENASIRIASFSGYTKIVELLLQDGRADPTVDDNAPIRNASCNGHTEIVELLLRDGRVDPTAQNNFVLRRACMYSHTKVVEILLQDGRVEATDQAIKNARTDEIKEMLLKYKYRVDGSEYCRLKNNLASL
jgi:ankyrin repeat protein